MPLFTKAICFRARILASRGATRSYARNVLDSDERVFVACNSSAAQFIALSLRESSNPPPVTLIVNTAQYLYQYLNGLRHITLQDGDQGQLVKRHVRIELVRSPYRSHGRIISMAEARGPPTHKPHYDRLAPGEVQQDLPPNLDQLNRQPIHHLVVAEPPQYMVSQLLAVKHRLGPHSTVLLVNSLPGIIDRVTREVFPDAEQRPKFLLGELTHGISRPKHSLEHGNSLLFQIIHDRVGFLKFCRTPLFSGEPIVQLLPGEQRPESQSDYLVQVLQRAARLSALELGPLDLHIRQLNAVAIRSVISPMTALMDHQNGALQSNDYLLRAMRLIIAETSLILRNLPELRGHPTVNINYSPDQIETVVGNIIKKNPHERSATVKNMRYGFTTDIDFVSGYLVDRAHQLGLKAFMNFMMQQLVKGKAKMIAKDVVQALGDESEHEID